jgi:hypothetical protein
VHRICEHNPQALDSGGCSDRKLNKTTSSQVLLFLLTLMEKREEKLVYIYKQGWKSIHKKYKAC